MSLEFKPLSQGLGLSHLPPVDPPRNPPTRRPPPSPVAPKPILPAAAPTLTTAPALTSASTVTRDRSILVRRIAAFSVDTLLNISILSVVFAASLFRFGPRVWDLLSFELGLVVSALFAFASWSLVLGQELLFKTSLGKWMFRLKLDGPRASIFVRAFFFPLSLLAGGLGLAWALWDARGRCWHDLLADLEPRLS